MAHKLQNIICVKQACVMLPMSQGAPVSPSISDMLEQLQWPTLAHPANTVRNITFVKVTFSSFMDERNEDVLGTYIINVKLVGRSGDVRVIMTTSLARPRYVHPWMTKKGP